MRRGGPSVISKLATSRGRKDEVPNQELARSLAESENRADVRKLVQNLTSDNAGIQSDCIKTLYEIGYLKPELIAPYARQLLPLLKSRNNRLVWGAMIALSTIGALAADELYPAVSEIQKAMEKGSIITVDAGVLALARIASGNARYNRAIFPYLIHHLQTCRPKEVPQHSEKILEAVTAGNRAELISVIEKRLKSATPTQAARLKRVISKAGKKQA
jgi:hypothetical protein